MLALYHFGPVANSLTPLLCLIEKGLAFDDRFLSSRRWEHHEPKFLALNPEGIVPVLVHDEAVITESTVINEYLEDVFPQVSLRPDDAGLRAQMRVWTKYVDEFFCPALTVLGAHGAVPFAAQIGKAEMGALLDRMPNPDVRRKWEIVSNQGYTSDALDDARAKLGHVVKKAELQLSHGKAWLLGDQYSLADIKFYSMAAALERMMPEVCNDAASPALTEWLRRVAARSAVKTMRGKIYSK